MARVAGLCGLLVLLGADMAGAEEGPRKYFTVSATAGTASVDIGGYGEPWMQTLNLEYHATRHFGLALTGHEFGEFRTRGVSSARLRLKATEYAAVASFRPMERMVLQGRIGYMPYELTADAFGYELGHEKASTTTLGLGMQMEFNSWWGLQLEARRALSVSDAALSWYALGLYVRFGPE